MNTNDRQKYPGIPEDFPVAPIPYALAGAQAKLNLVEEDGKYYSPGTSPSEVTAAFEVCEDLAQQFVKYCLDKESAKFGTHAEILERVRQRLLEKDWCTPAQCGWIARRTAVLLAWQLPDDFPVIQSHELTHSLAVANGDPQPDHSSQRNLQPFSAN